ncbi:metal-dependent transcriptional regulator [Solicola gregarius]|uniref:Metal-dependent transcriptional regulator n=1 Tax=Solicola gregarius TaxID=2908642 RepID=A0AA46TLL3_9ACTN|nr:metal-dependent transcriptional regulator [Solicola gregarius]UYM06683.1 metal-dependent transcriptional regulator [Solicola gregarius]
MSDLIDTTEMYLKAVYELIEEGVVPLRARIAERLQQSGPTVSQTVARMERDGLLSVEGDRHLEFSDKGRQLATRVMRKHRLAERLLTDVVGLEIEYVHDEACRWEHVMSERVERHLLELLKHPVESPYGTPIPGLDEFGETVVHEDLLSGVAPLPDAARAAGPSPTELVVRRIAEPLQVDIEVLALMRRVGVLPGDRVVASITDTGVLVEGANGESADIDDEAAKHILVEKL